MKELLLINSNDKYREPLLALLHQCGLKQIELAYSGSEVRRLVQNQNYPMVIVNTPLADEFGHELGSYLSRKNGCLVLLLVKNEIAEEMSVKTQRDGILVLAKPINRGGFAQAVRLMTSCVQKIRLLQEENEKLRATLQQDRIISRAKCLLIERGGFTEEQAHHFLEQQAMNQRTTRYEVARDVCAQYAD